MRKIFSGDKLLFAISWLTALIGQADKKKTYSVEVKEHREKRSRDANAYMWLLCHKIADAMNGGRTSLDVKTSLDVYREHIYQANIYKEVVINEAAEGTFMTSWGMHGDGWLCRRADYSQKEGFVILHAYYGSSVYNTKQMARLIDGIVQDARALGIETKTPAELVLLVDEWKPAS